MARSQLRLDPLFHPKSIAVIGAKDEEATVGRTLLTNLKSGGFSGKIYPVNPKRNAVLGMKCYSCIREIPERVDLAVIVTPAKTVPVVLRECVEAKVRSCIVISAGFKEMGPEGAQLEDELVEIAKNAKIPLIGPNCLGVMNPHSNLNATFARGQALKGHLGFISQSGAMCTAVLDWSLKEKIGFSAFVSIGSMADVDWGDLIDYLGNDPETTSLLLYMETIGNPRKFLSAAREIAIEKPIIVIKGGRTAKAAQAAASHTGSLACSDEIFNAALERVGVLRVESIGELFQMASVLARQPRPKGPNLAIITNAGGPGVLATDAAILAGASLCPIQGETLEALNRVLPAAWSKNNPIDLIGDADAKRYADAIEIIGKDDACDALLAILSPQDMTDAESAARAILPFASTSKPLLASWMGGESVAKGVKLLNEAGVPTFEYPDDAAKTFSAMWRYSQTIQTLYEMPDPSLFQSEESGDQRAIFRSGKELLDEYESKRLLADYGIPIVETEIAHSVQEARLHAEKIGYPSVLKLYSHTITHKSDVGGVKLDLKSPEAVEKAFLEIQAAVPAKDFEGVTVQKMVKLDGYELILGAAPDPLFGPVLLFGWGGQLVEVFKDKSLALPPLNKALALSMIEKTKIATALKGVRGKKPINMDLLAELLVRFSMMITQNPRIKECDINPLLVSDQGMVALDARIILYPLTVKDSELPKLAIRPYPFQYVQTFQSKSGATFCMRPIRPEDEADLIAYHKELSENSVRQRYFDFISLDKRIAHERLLRICFNDFDREIALVAQEEKTRKIAGVIRLSRIPGRGEAVMTMLIADTFHGQGIGKYLIENGIEIAKKEGIKTIHAFILDENAGMLHISKKAGFTFKNGDAQHIVHATLKLE